MSHKTQVTKNGASPPKGVVEYESPYMREPRQFSIWRGIYNRDKNFILGRTPTNWGSLFLFYAVFYIVLSAMFAICMQGLFATLSSVEPKWQLDSSRIGSNPGLGFRPISDNLEHGSLIWFEGKNKNQTAHWAELIEGFLEPYITASQMSNTNHSQSVACSFDKGPKEGSHCSVDVDNFGPCTMKNGYGYNKSAPCIFLKLNKIFNWVPDYYDDINNLPEEMPTDLKLYIASLPVNNRKQVWVTCGGENPADREILGPVKYYPKRGLASYYYPYKNVKGYLSPLIAVQFERPGLHRIINIECRAWAKNIIYNGSYRDRQGSVHFELMID